MPQKDDEAYVLEVYSLIRIAVTKLRILKVRRAKQQGVPGLSQLNAIEDDLCKSALALVGLPLGSPRPGGRQL